MLGDFPGGIWAVDFEFHRAHGRPGNRAVPVCMVAQDLCSGQSLRVWQDDLVALPCPPFPVDASALFVAYYASAELNCFEALGWPIPENVIDLYAEFRLLTNDTRSGKRNNSLLGALAYFSLAAISAAEKVEMRDLVLSGGPWSEAERVAILEYCESDVRSLGELFSKMLPHLDLARALVRGRYMKSIAVMESNGIPIDTQLLARIEANRFRLQDLLIEVVDSEFGIFEGRTFKAVQFARYLDARNIPWPRLGSGCLDLKDETFKSMASAYPELAALRELRQTLAQLRSIKLEVGDDHRARCLLSPFSSRTGRNQPSTNRFAFGLPAWMRALIQPAPGRALAYLDWSQQEFGIAAALSGDSAMMDAYSTGDPYLAFAKQAGAAPASATKDSHKAVRDQFKACVLAVQYGMGAESLAARIRQPIARARQLLDLHRRTYKTFWEFSDSASHQAALGGQLWTPFGWRIQTAADPNDRSLRNFPMQATGADILRIACVLLNEADIRICAPVHDAILIEASDQEIAAVAAQAQCLMKDASRIVLGGFELASDAKFIRYPERYVDERGAEMLATVMRLLDEAEQTQVRQPAGTT